jgi:hypothetical protein
MDFYNKKNLLENKKIGYKLVIINIPVLFLDPERNTRPNRSIPFFQ